MPNYDIPKYTLHQNISYALISTKVLTVTFVLFIIVLLYIPAGIYLLKVNNRSTRTRCEICSKLTIKTPE